MLRILALECGGIKGAFTAGVLATLEDDTGHRCIDHFDLIAGTSTGGIIALGLALGLPAAEIVDFYRNYGPTIFPGTSLARRWSGVLRHLFQPKHSHLALWAALTEVFGKRKFGEAQRPLVIPTYDAVGGRIFVLKTAHHRHLRHDCEAPAVDVALATAAAPTYFAAAQFPNHGNNSHVDGGVWANSPTLAALVEAVHFLGQRLEDLDILSIGTTTSPFNVSEKQWSGILGWNAALVEILMTAQQEAANAQSMLLVNRRFHRIDYKALRVQFSLDDARPEQIERLIALGRGEAVKKENIDLVRERFLNGQHALPLTPVYNVE